MSDALTEHGTSVVFFKKFPCVGLSCLSCRYQRDHVYATQIISACSACDGKSLLFCVIYEIVSAF